MAVRPSFAPPHTLTRLYRQVYVDSSNHGREDNAQSTIFVVMKASVCAQEVAAAAAAAATAAADV